MSAESISINLWTRCMLEGEALEDAVIRLLGKLPFFEDLVLTQQIAIQPPHTIHRNPGGWERIEEWRATVSADVRTFPSPHPSSIGTWGWVGRGCGPDPVTACHRAVVASFGEVHP